MSAPSAPSRALEVQAHLLAAQQANHKAVPHVDFGAVRMKHVRWLWRNRIPLEEITIIQGDPGIGKGHLAVEIAARLTTGRPLPDDTAPQRVQRVLWLTTEDDAERALKPRFVAAGANAPFVTTLPEGTSISFPSQLPLLKALLRTKAVEDPAHPVGLVVIDPLSEFVDDGVDLNKTGQSRRVLKELTRVARAFQVVILIIHHLNKTSGNNRQSALHRGSGNLSGIGGTVRSVLMAAPDPQDATQYVLAAVKHNLGPRPASLVYRLESCAVEEAGDSFETSRLVWAGTSAAHADDLAAPLDSGADDRTEAENFLLEFLENGPRSVRDIEAECKARAVSFGGAVRRASVRLKISKGWNREGELPNTPAHSFYVWRLP